MSLRTAATEFHLRRRHAAVGQQERAFRALIPSLARTKIWREAGIGARLAYPDFRSRIAPRTAEQIAPAVERMQAGEPDVLWPGRCALFAATAGTTRGSPAHVPVTEKFLQHVRRGLLDVGLYYTVRARHAGVFQGRHLWLGGPTALKPLERAAGQPAWLTTAWGAASAALPKWLETHQHEPGAAIGSIEDTGERLRRAVARTAGLDISLLAGAPEEALALGTALRQHAAASGRTLANAQQLWPNLEVFVHTRTPITPFYDELRALLGPSVRFHECYAATEAFIATQDGEPAAGLRLMANRGVFFEFLPLAEFDSARLDSLGPRLLPLAQVTTGVDYAIFVTTPAGLVRHALDDVVRFVSVAPPRLVYTGRTTLRLNAFGENVLEREITDALASVCRRSGWTIADFHVAPLFSVNLTGANRGRHEWWVELHTGTVATPRGPQLAGELDIELQRLNAEYAARRRAGVLDAPFVRLVMPGVFSHWLQYAGRADRTPRCRSDRAVADELAQITQFARD